MPHLSYGGGNFPAHPLAPSVTLLRDKLLLDFSHSLTSKGTPPAILWDILHGFSAWLTPDSSHARAHTFGSLLTAGIALTSAFYEQYHKLGWYQTCWGRITRGWSKALEEYNIQAGTTLESQYWSSSLIENLRVLTMGLWRHRNQIEHGDSIEEQARVLLTTLQNQVMDLYSEFSTNPSFILLRHHYLFEHRTLAERLDMSYDSLQAWVRSVQEAIKVREFQETLERDNDNRFFSNQSTHISSNSSLDSDYTPTMATTATTGTFTNTCTYSSSFQSYHSAASVSLQPSQTTDTYPSHLTPSYTST